VSVMWNTKSTNLSASRSHTGGHLTFQPASIPSVNVLQKTSLKICVLNETEPNNDGGGDKDGTGKRGPPGSESRSFFSGIQIPVLIQKYRFFGINLKNNCLWFIPIKVIKSTTIKHQYYRIYRLSGVAIFFTRAQNRVLVRRRGRDWRRITWTRRLSQSLKV
jgi:hypothetical protein